MRVLGVDPGYDRLGAAILTYEDGKETCLFSTCLETPKTLPFPDRLKLLGDMLNQLIAENKPTHLGIETLYFNTNQKTAMAVAEARGVVLYLARQHNLMVFEYTPQQVKVAVTGHGGSTKDAVATMLPKICVGVGTAKHDDEYDAIAVGLTCLVSVRTIST